MRLIRRSFNGKTILTGDNIQFQSDKMSAEDFEKISQENEIVDYVEPPKEYAELRLNEYNKLNQFEMMYNDRLNGTDTWFQAITEIKNRFPKREL